MATIANGTFTLIWPDGDRHKTFKIKTQKADSKFMPGKRLISLMTGRDNESDYTTFGEATDSGLNIWHSVLNGTSKNAYVMNDGKLPIWLQVLWDIATKGDQSQYFQKGMRLEASETCIVCNRKLTNPLSISTKIGPECAARRAAPRMPRAYGGKRLPTMQGHAGPLIDEDPEFDDGGDNAQYNGNGF